MIIKLIIFLLYLFLDSVSSVDQTILIFFDVRFGAESDLAVVVDNFSLFGGRFSICNDKLLLMA